MGRAGKSGGRSRAQRLCMPPGCPSARGARGRAGVRLAGRRAPPPAQGPPARAPEAGASSAPRRRGERRGPGAAGNLVAVVRGGEDGHAPAGGGARVGTVWDAEGGRGGGEGAEETATHLPSCCTSYPSCARAAGPLSHFRHVTAGEGGSPRYRPSPPVTARARAAGGRGAWRGGGRARWGRGQGGRLL